MLVFVLRWCGSRKIFIFLIEYFLKVVQEVASQQQAQVTSSGTEKAVKICVKVYKETRSTYTVK